ncbi:MAG TPA: T9SS type A sorting domain-containing protein [Cyclobacteriaceae bacterium]|nr:T9SS type A sorting domain-containing protein [Cyclobacteriaceae bacterium]
MKAFYSSFLGVLFFVAMPSLGFGQLSVYNPSPGTVINQCQTYVLRYGPGEGFSSVASAEVHLGDWTGPTVQTLGYPAGYLSMNYDNNISAASLTPGNTYQIKVYDYYYPSNWAWSGIFTVTAFPAPTSISQMNNYYDWIEIKWPPVPGASSYGVDVATSTDFSTGIVWANHPASGTDPYGLYITGLTSGTTYYTRVRAYGSCGASGYSGIYSFSTLTCLPLSPPTANSATQVSPTQFTANWTTVPGASSYDLIVTGPGSSTSTYNTIGNTYSVTTLPQSNYTYKVKTRTCALSGESNTVSVASPGLSKPIMGSATGRNHSGGFWWDASWTSVNGAASYDFQVSSTSDFAFHWDATTSDTHYEFEAEFCATYYVRSRAKCCGSYYSDWATAKELPGASCRTSAPEGHSQDITSAQLGSDNFTISPNPAEHILRVTFPKPLKNSVEFVVTDLAGRNFNVASVLSETYAEVDVAELASGIYLISFTDGLFKQRSKFVKR